MKVLLADDDLSLCTVISARLRHWGYTVVTAHDGDEAWAALSSSDPPLLAILDWNMPAQDGATICRKLREQYPTRPVYAILLTARDTRQDILDGLAAGADEYIVKPFDADDLLARLKVGQRIVNLQTALAEHAEQLERSLAQVKQLQGLLPICAYCKRIRDDRDYWHQVEQYISKHSEAQFSHGICPECFKTHVEPKLEAMSRARAATAGNAVTPC